MTGVELKEVNEKLHKLLLHYDGNIPLLAKLMGVHVPTLHTWAKRGRMRAVGAKIIRDYYEQKFGGVKTNSEPIANFRL